MSDEIYDYERESLENAEPPFTGPYCPLCGAEIWWPWNPQDYIHCPNCGANVKPRPTLIKGDA
jgi:DNA-directed RNA polymerase subunit RPC12/RpoP